MWSAATQLRSEKFSIAVVLWVYGTICITLNLAIENGYYFISRLLGDDFYVQYALDVESVIAVKLGYVLGAGFKFAALYVIHRDKHVINPDMR